MKILTNGKIVSEGKILEGYDIIIDDKKIVEIKPTAKVSGEKINLKGNYVARFKAFGKFFRESGGFRFTFHYDFFQKTPPPFT